MRKIIVIAAAMLFAAATGSAQQMPDLPNDPAVKVGKLENGLTYYIRHNDKPAQRAEFYLATNVGALQETPDQDGLAHFLEHMCFNGTKNFPGKGILNWLESIGASFGGNVNASTGVEQTIYLLNNIPLVRPTVVDSCLLVMHDYSHFVLCEPEEIDAERGVILEEKRSRNNAQWRMREAMGPYLFGDTKYASTSIIGSEENLKTFKPESLTSFYQTWYHPDMQALIVVGDIDVDEVEAKIKSTFADIPAAENPKQKEIIAIPVNEEPLVGILTDPENAGTSWDVIFKSERMDEAYNSTQIGFVTELLKSIISQVMSERLEDIAAQPESAFLNGDCYIGKLCETCEMFEAEVGFKEEHCMEALTALLTELEKLRRYGLEADEIERAKSNILAAAESAAKNAESRKNSDFVMPLISHFFDNESFLTPQTRFELLQMMMPQLQPAIISQAAQQLVTRENMVVLYTGPDSAAKPEEEQVKELVRQIQNSEIAKSSGEAIPTDLLNAKKLKGSKIKASAPYAYDSEIITLANGVKVVLKPSELEKDVISIELVKKGGESLIADEDMYSFESNIFGLWRQNSGVAGFSATTLSKMLSGKNVSVSPTIKTYTHGISASTTPKDVETALQLMYLQFCQPRFDQNEFNQGIKQIESVLPGMESQPSYQLQKALISTFFDSPRKLLISQEVVDKANLATVERVYKQLFKDAAGAVVYVVGDFDKESIMPLIQKYIGSLPKGKKESDWKYCGDGLVDGTKVNDFQTAMQTPKVTVFQAYKINDAFSYENEVAMDALEYILNMTYVETLRESEGGTYGASVGGSCNRDPHAMSLIQIAFETNAEAADRLRALTLEGIKGIAENGPDADKYDKTVKNLEKKIPESKTRLSYWKSNLLEYQLFGTDRDGCYSQAVAALTPEKVQALAARLLESGNFLEIVMRPKE